MSKEFNAHNVVSCYTFYPILSGFLYFSLKNGIDRSTTTWRLHKFHWKGTSEAEAKPERNSLNLNRCISHDSAELSHHMPQSPCFVSTNQEVQTRQGLPHQPPILQINPSKCHWNVTARQGRVKTKGKLQMNSPQLFDRWLRSRLTLPRAPPPMETNELYFAVCGSGMFVLFPHGVGF